MIECYYTLILQIADNLSDFVEGVWLVPGELKYLKSDCRSIQFRAPHRQVNFKMRCNYLGMHPMASPICNFAIGSDCAIVVERRSIFDDESYLHPLISALNLPTIKETSMSLGTCISHERPSRLSDSLQICGDIQV